MASEKSRLLRSSRVLKSPGTIASESFIVATSFTHELQLTISRCMLISLQMISELGTIVIAILFVGQLPNSALYLSGVGFARTFVNVTGTAMAWGFTTSLFTLLPQAIGAGQTRLAAIHIQRAFYIVTVVAALLSIIQFFAGDIMVAIGQPPELRHIVNTYCRLLIPYIFLVSYVTVLQRILQSLDLNILATWCALLMFISCPLFTWFFMYYLQCGYYGAAIAQCCSMTVFFLSELVMIIYKGYGFMLIPLPVRLIWTKRGIHHYLALAIPGLFQTAFQWIIEEVGVILAGYVAQPTIALSTTVILSNLFLFVVAFGVAICNATNIRVGKYIGRGSIKHAQRAARVGAYVAVFAEIVISLVFIFGRNALPRMYTDNADTLQLTSKMMNVLVIYSCGAVTLQVTGGVYRGLGLQKMAAVFVFVSYWLISLPVSIVLLFVLRLREDVFYGTMTIWAGTLALGNVLGCVCQITYMLLCANWQRAVSKSETRIQHTIMEYRSIE
mmetsp:Transcript_25400/g.40408  ORF Transcript_25400/g.40408 Transcript_25400/m.40408 type:complete len:500 (+) Transcript_25400:30-1529(+)|eukprot:CAMPEP_0197025346 /NCGR_PEP_ID=MMETSP1384-20130603/5720_1 /TAXON_ID=29189 /ORGANISM="Ammonia sp." /LENGTH=499 /DNA_ID=CAMNT_0042453873 /DNA_START=25 /DNA_END=1524 /DNA_ORIENTATION=+